jgi:sarcosine oxidase gamma subunit
LTKAGKPVAVDRKKRPKMKKAKTKAVFAFFAFVQVAHGRLNLSGTQARAALSAAFSVGLGRITALHFSESAL